MPDFAELHRERQQHPRLTQRANPDGYRYPRFSELYQRWRRKQDLVLRQEHKTGEKLFVDWAGTTIPIEPSHPELRDRINQRPFRKREGSRASQFVPLDRPALSPLPVEPFDLSQWSRARVNIDYHIVFDANYYSVWSGLPPGWCTGHRPSARTPRTCLNA
jgi:hypothetical protein